MANPEFTRGIELVGSAVIENAEGKILLCKSPKWHDKWIMPGGHIEPGEKVMEGIAREAEEESGLKVRPLAVIDANELINSNDFHRPAHFIYFDVACEVVSESPKLDNDELTEFKWVTPEEGLKMDLAETYDRTIQKYMEWKKSR